MVEVSIPVIRVLYEHVWKNGQNVPQPFKTVAVGPLMGK